MLQAYSSFQLLILYKPYQITHVHSKRSHACIICFTGEKNYPCPQCGKSFLNQQQMKNHINSTHGGNVIACVGGIGEDVKNLVEILLT